MTRPKSELDKKQWAVALHVELIATGLTYSDALNVAKSSGKAACVITAAAAKRLKGKG